MYANDFVILGSIARERESKREQRSPLHSHKSLNDQHKVHLELSANCDDLNPVQYIKITHELLTEVNVLD